MVWTYGRGLSCWEFHQVKVFAVPHRGAGSEKQPYIIECTAVRGSMIWRLRWSELGSFVHTCMVWWPMFRACVRAYASAELESECDKSFPNGKKVSRLGTGPTRVCVAVASLPLTRVNEWRPTLEQMKKGNQNLRRNNY